MGRMAFHRRSVLLAGAFGLFGGKVETLAALTTPPAGGQATPAGGPLAVTGQVIFPEDLPDGPAAPITVTVQDVSRADAPSIDLASVTIPAGAVAPVAGEAIPFSIPVETFDPGLTYSVRTHVDRDGDGRVSRGDLVSTTHNPVLTRGAGTVVDVPLSVVG